MTADEYIEKIVKEFKTGVKSLGEFKIPKHLKKAIREAKKKQIKKAV